MKGNAEGATLLAISTDKEKYNPGDEIKLTFPSPENSRAIITLENATGVIDEIRVPTQKANTIVTLKATPEMAPNVYAYVSVIQPHSQKINDMPIRFYGVVPVMVEDPGSRLSPKIEVADEIRSQKPFEIKISEENRKAMTYTVAVVDEGLLDITGFKTPILGHISMAARLSVSVPGTFMIMSSVLSAVLSTGYLQSEAMKQ
jgi:hypothetical protein